MRLFLGWRRQEKPPTSESTPPAVYLFTDYKGTPVPVLLRDHSGEVRSTETDTPWLNLDQAVSLYARPREYLIGLHEKFFEDLRN